MLNGIALDEQIKTNNVTNNHFENYPIHDTLPHLTKFPEWQDLVEEYKLLRTRSIRQLFNENKHRNEQFTISATGINLNFANQAINQKSMYLLAKIASQYNLKSHIEALFSGGYVNTNENKPALHTSLRSSKNDMVEVNGEKINFQIRKCLHEMEKISKQIQNNTWFKSKQKKITNIVNIGIGGSDLGPKMAVRALANYKTTQISCHFISDSDPDRTADLFNTLNPASTLFIVASKSFTTLETLTNLNNAIQWLGETNEISEHIIAITANTKLANDFKIKHILPIWSWVGGRFSFFSAVNLTLMISIGSDNFKQLMHGAEEMDIHFRNTPFTHNLPVMLALLGIWNINFFRGNNHLLQVYSQRLAHLTSYIQQLDMESNGKSISTSKTILNYSTGPIIWGGLGSQAEHAYYQLLYQGAHYTSIDYIFIDEKKYEPINIAANKKLNALSFGEVNQNTVPHLANIRSGINKLTLNTLSPATLGSLIAMYEHKIYCQSVMWRINAFDQPGVDAAKKFSLPL